MLKIKPTKRKHTSKTHPKNVASHTIRPKTPSPRRPARLREEIPNSRLCSALTSVARLLGGPPTRVSPRKGFAAFCTVSRVSCWMGEGFAGKSRENRDGDGVERPRRALGKLGHFRAFPASFGGTPCSIIFKRDVYF